MSTRPAPWTRPPRARVIRIRDRLREMYGQPAFEAHRAPLDELVLTVLSQNTNDRNRDVAYFRLRERFPTWREVRDASVEEVEEAIRPGGLAQSKAPRLRAILDAVGPHLDLAWLEEAPREQALEFLCGLPGVGRKTAACVQLFSFGLPEVPVDTHVFRVGGRLGLFREKASFEEAHEEMLAVTPPGEAFEFHVNLLRHGRRTCRPKPRCSECALRRMCPAYRRFAAGDVAASQGGRAHT